MGASSKAWRSFVLPPSRSGIDTIATGGLGNWASNLKSPLETRQERPMERGGRGVPKHRERVHAALAVPFAADDAQRRSMQVNDPASPPGAVGVGITPNFLASKFIPPATPDTKIAAPPPGGPGRGAPARSACPPNWAPRPGGNTPPAGPHLGGVRRAAHAARLV